ncbi:uncharacterized protein BO95DRAFT_468048 [Aspergillus brunneoviolaceus CBS 621.78]|uniref:Uncharacterized protein n=1 Tax=Aspergillus brunneoviolaceus CBS 621.78 TaxID=1450534 RepID=A0ACD1FVY9_9EURO|nr:hypothetical protein BO95DRAFT_468048 [Aspergillus brunneoviolaceus CBS 621.78]RAH41188.1 hypothetical protein BO95DRAFT_468048 [Aspergillus brunneoviolaceus CBS 621.78]
MSVTVTAQIVDVASLIPSTVSPAEEEKLFLPGVFEQVDVAGFDRDHDHDWPLPLESDVFRSMLYQFTIFSHGYDIFRKQDWVEFTQNLQRLLRYLISGEAKAGGIRACLKANSSLA